MTRCPHCGHDLDVAPVVKPSPDYRSLARHFGAVRGRAGIYKNEQVAEAAFRALYPAQGELCEAAMAGWRETL